MYVLLLLTLCIQRSFRYLCHLYYLCCSPWHRFYHRGHCVSCSLKHCFVWLKSAQAVFLWAFFCSIILSAFAVYLLRHQHEILARKVTSVYRRYVSLSMPPRSSVRNGRLSPNVKLELGGKSQAGSVLVVSSVP